MSRSITSIALGTALLTGGAVAAHAQSVSALPPTSPATAPAAVTPPQSYSKIYPDPGGSGNWQAEPARPVASGRISPDPGGSANWQHQPYAATAVDKDASRHPYSSGMGPKPN